MENLTRSQKFDYCTEPNTKLTNGKITNKHEKYRIYTFIYTTVQWWKWQLGTCLAVCYYQVTACNVQLSVMLSHVNTYRKITFGFASKCTKNVLAKLCLDMLQNMQHSPSNPNWIGEEQGRVSNGKRERRGKWEEKEGMHIYLCQIWNAWNFITITFSILCTISWTVIRQQVITTLAEHWFYYLSITLCKNFTAVRTTYEILLQV